MAARKSSTGKNAKPTAASSGGETRKMGVTKSTRPSAAKAKKATSKRPTKKDATSPVMVELSHERIAERAYQIWQDKGCPPHQDDANWREAEAQLRQKHGA